MTAKSATKSANAKDANLTTPSQITPVTVKEAVQAIIQNDMDVIRRYFCSTEHVDLSVIDALHEVYSPRRVRRILEAYGPKLLNASAYHTQWRRSASVIESQHGIHLNRRTLARLAALGRGPSGDREDQVVAWARETFALAPRDAASETARDEARQRPLRALVISTNSPDTDWAADQLRAFGLDVVFAPNWSLAAVNAAAHDDYDIAYFDPAFFNRNTIVAVTDWLQDREKPHIVCSSEHPSHSWLPPSVTSSAIILGTQSGPEDFRALVRKCLAQHDQTGLSLDAPIVLWNGEELQDRSLLSPGPDLEWDSEMHQYIPIVIE